MMFPLKFLAPVALAAMLATPALAGAQPLDAPGGEASYIGSDVPQPRLSRSRAQVRAEVLRARRDGTLMRIGEGDWPVSGTSLPAPQHSATVNTAHMGAAGANRAATDTYSFVGGEAGWVGDDTRR